MNIVHPASANSDHVNPVPVPAPVSVGAGALVPDGRLTSNGVHDYIITRLLRICDGFATMNITEFGYQDLYRLMVGIGMELFTTFNDIDVEAFQLARDSHAYLPFVTAASLRAKLAEFQANACIGKIGNMRSRLIRQQAIMTWFDNFETRFQTFYTDNVAEPAQQAAAAAAAAPVVPVPNVLIITNRELNEMIDVQVRLVQQLDQCNAIRPNIPTNDNRVERIRSIFTIRDQFIRRYAREKQEYLDAVDEYCKNRFKILIIQRLLTLRIAANPEEAH